jgi:hypothetical protein
VLCVGILKLFVDHELVYVNFFKFIFYFVFHYPGFAEQLVEDAISSIFLNPHIWLHAAYNVQRELYMFLIQQLDNDPRLLGSLCRLPRVIDIVWNFYWESERYCKGSKPLMHPTRTIAERPSRDEIHKIRLLLLSLGEMSLRHVIHCKNTAFLASIFYDVIFLET